MANADAGADLTRTAIVHDNLSLAYDAVGHYQQSVNADQNAVSIVQAMGDPIIETYALNKMKLVNQVLIEADIGQSGCDQQRRIQDVWGRMRCMRFCVSDKSHFLSVR